MYILRNNVDHEYGFVAHHPTQGSWKFRKAQNIENVKSTFSLFCFMKAEYCFISFHQLLQIRSHCLINILTSIALLLLCPLLSSLAQTLFQPYRPCLIKWFSIHIVIAYCRLLRTQIMNGAVFCFPRAASFFLIQSKSRSGRNSQRLNGMIMSFLITPLGWDRQCKSAQFLPSHRVVLTKCVINCYCSFICTNQWMCNWVPPSDSLTTDRRQKRKVSMQIRKSAQVVLAAVSI